MFMERNFEHGGIICASPRWCEAVDNPGKIGRIDNYGGSYVQSLASMYSRVQNLSSILGVEEMSLVCFPASREMSGFG
jgi:hypothetical protein